MFHCECPTRLSLIMALSLLFLEPEAEIAGCQSSGLVPAVLPSTSVGLQVPLLPDPVASWVSDRHRE